MSSTISTRTTETNQVWLQDPQRDPAMGPKRSMTTPLTLSTSRQGNGTVVSQSSAVYSALPPQSEPRTTSRPMHFSPISSSGSTTKGVPSSPKSPTSMSTKSKRGSMDRRLSDDPKANAYTHCGRHSDEWLFGGISKAWSWTDRERKE